MVKLLCSLCGKKTEADALDMDDVVFGNYVLLMRRLGLSGHHGPLGVCLDCMPEYLKMQSGHRKKLMQYFILGVIFALIYLALTWNLAMALAIAVFVSALSIFSYCPPLKGR
ncbi:MAG: hypothetical protein ABII71_05705 [Candidatus Micrarchaeota archaeon]